MKVVQDRGVVTPLVPSIPQDEREEALVVSKAVQEWGGGGGRPKPFDSPFGRLRANGLRVRA